MTSTDDYRRSHIESGGHYDATLAASGFDAYMAGWERRHLQAIVHDLYPRGVERCLDFACGTGRVTATVAPLSRATVGVDISPSMLQVAREKVPQASFVQADLTRDDPDLGRFDLVTSFRFFGNAQHELRNEVLGALVRRMEPGGHLVINSHRNPRALYALLDRLTGGDAGSMDLHPAKLRSLLARHGLVVRRLVPIGAWMVRARLLEAYRHDDPVAQRREQRFGHAIFAPIAPDLIVVAQRA